MSLRTIDRIVTNPAYHDILSIVKGARNGFVYGAKVRFPHAVVMTLLFQSGSWQKRGMTVYRATRQHSFNLAKFCAIYKSVMILQRRLNKGKERLADTFFAGLIGGWIVFGDRNPVNEQIVLYVISRAVTSFLPRASPTSTSKPPERPFDPTTPPPRYPKPIPPHSRVFTVYAAVAWGAVMWLFRNKRQTLQSGMVSSMQYLYNDSDYWTGLRTLIWSNT